MSLYSVPIKSKLSCISSYKGTNPTIKVEPSWPNYLTKSSSPNTITLMIGVLKYELGSLRSSVHSTLQRDIVQESRKNKKERGSIFLSVRDWNSKWVASISWWVPAMWKDKDLIRKNIGIRKVQGKRKPTRWFCKKTLKWLIKIWKSTKNSSVQKKYCTLLIITKIKPYQTSLIIYKIKKEKFLS